MLTWYVLSFLACPYRELLLSSALLTGHVLCIEASVPHVMCVA